MVRITGSHIVVDGEAGREEFDRDDPIAWIEEYRQRYRTPDVPGLPRFNGGLVGYFGYDSVRYFEPRLGPAPGEDVLGVPDILLMRSEEVVVFDNLRGSLFLVVHVDPAEEGARAGAEARLDELQRKLRAPCRSRSTASTARRWTRTISSPSFPATGTPRRWRKSASTSSPATSCRWCRPSA